jgi:transposase-like protein
MEKENNALPKEFFKQFKTKEDFKSFFNDLYKRGVEEMLQGELDAWLGYEKHSKAGYNSGNSRNGSYSKRVKTDSLGDLLLNIPRDRKSEFDPVLIPKGQRMSDKLEESIIGMYSRGMSTRDIRDYVKEIYGVDVSESTVSNVTDRIIDHIKQWQDRPLEEVYYVVWMDGVVLKIKQDGRYINKCIYLIIGLKKDGMKEVLGMWSSENESSSFWLNVLTDIKSRGVKDILIGCIDNLKGLNEAIKAAFPKTITQLCIVHQIRNSTKYVILKDRKEYCADMKQIYDAPTLQAAELAFDRFKQKWVQKYSYAIKSWETNWTELTAYFDFPVEIRKIIYTTNIIENLNRGIRKYTKTKSLFPDDMAAYKTVYLAINNIEKKWITQIKNWGLIINQFIIIFAERCKL